MQLLKYFSRSMAFLCFSVALLIIRLALPYYSKKVFNGSIVEGFCLQTQKGSGLRLYF
jgi:hypothetical protein